MRLRSSRPGRDRVTERDPSAASIAEKVRVRINGVEQGMFIRGRDRGNPILLYLHGGMPEFFLEGRYHSGLDEDFVVVWWEQRGSGLSFHRGIPADSMTPGQLVADTVELARRLCVRFAREKVFLMGHSGGTFIGIQAAALAPELFYAYIGVAQMTHQLESEALAYAFMLEQARARGDRRLARKLESAPVNMTLPLPRAYESVRDVAMHRLGIGTTHEMDSVVRGIVLESLRSGDYTLGEKAALWRGKLFSGGHLWDAELATDLREQVPSLEVPAYFLHGILDYTVSYPLAKGYLEALRAPTKGFYTFERSAHSPQFEEPGKTRTILREDVLHAQTSLAD